MAGRAPPPCGPPTGRSELLRHPVHSPGGHHLGVWPCAISRSGGSLGPEGWGQGQAQHALQPEGLASLRAPVHSAPASRPGSCLSHAHSPRARQSTPQSCPHPLTLTMHPPSAPRPPPLPGPPRPPPPAHTAPSRVHQLSSEVPATWGQVNSRRYPGDGRGRGPSAWRAHSGPRRANWPEAGARWRPGTDPGLGGVGGGRQLAIGVFSPSKAHVGAALSVSPVHPHLSSPPSLPLLSPALV